MFEILLPMATTQGLQNVALVLFGALVIDAIIGEPKWLYQRVTHPVAIIGKFIDVLETAFFKRRQGRGLQMASGLSLVLICLAVFAGAAMLIAWICTKFSAGSVVLMLLTSMFLAGRSLFDHVREVAHGLTTLLQGGREAVAKIVGRDPDSLDQAGIARAAIESLAENFSDAVVAPVLWFLLLGFPGLVAYKVINTLDSMIGHRNDRYEWFGKVAARLDDAVNWPAARLSGFILVLAAAVVPGFHGQSALVTMLRDAGQHKSVNAGWPEAAMAGALNIALAGPRVYDGKRVEDDWMGTGRQDIAAPDIDRALRLYLTANVILASSVLSLWWLLSEIT